MSEEITVSTTVILISQIKKKIEKIDQESTKLLHEYMKSGLEDVRYHHQRLQLDRKLYADIIDDYFKSFDS